MKVEELSIDQKASIASDYINRPEECSSFFDYQTFDDKALMKRASELKGRSYQREALANYLLDYHKRLEPSEKTMRNINKLRKPDSVAVVGGQQAGLLTGPLYTIHKCISIIKLAEEQELKLGVPVIPIFWVAGEDHDFDEINHVFVESDGALKKKIFQTAASKQSVSHMDMSASDLVAWIKRIMSHYGETIHTNNLLSQINTSIEQSDTYTDFFSRLILGLFGKRGLVVIDSGDQKLRVHERPLFRELIHNNEAIDQSFEEGLIKIKESGFPEPVQSVENNAHLFLQINGKRVLLIRDEGGGFKGKNGECILSKSQLLDLIEKEPERLSNNVVTRPLMQEFLLPTLAFIAGSGEIAYWAALKDVFKLFHYKIPPLVPRLSLTLVEQKHAKTILDKELNLKEVLQGGITEAREQWLQNQQKWNTAPLFQETANQLKESHQSLINLATEIDPGLKKLAEKNQRIILSQLEFLHHKADQMIRKKYEHELRKFDSLSNAVNPNGQLQERVWNAFYFLNLYGPSFVDDLMNLGLAFNGKHKVVYL